MHEVRIDEAAAAGALGNSQIATPDVTIAREMDIFLEVNLRRSAGTPNSGVPSIRWSPVRRTE